MTMDEVFQILIYVLIAVSFLSSLFKKKKPIQPPPQDVLQQDQSNVGDKLLMKTPPSQNQKAADYNILKEFESFFNLNVPAAAPRQTSIAEHSDEQVYEGAKNRDNYVKVPEESFHKATSSEHSFTDPGEQKRTEIEKQKKTITPEIEKKASKYQTNLEIKDTAATEIAHNISNRIKDPATLKEYIVISEIIGKPKALRGWSKKNIS